jgi:alpha-tubulin suppressor-like RCC1 family protein
VVAVSLVLKTCEVCAATSAVGNERHGPNEVHGPGNIDTLNSISANQGGEAHNVALKSDGTAWTWGFNASGQLENGPASIAARRSTARTAEHVPRNERRGVDLDRDGQVKEADRSSRFFQ